MDFIEYAKWGIRVKEEPGTIDPFHLDKESNENNFGEVQGNWMCKFPCDAQRALDVAATDNLTCDLLEPFEPSHASYLEEEHEYFNFHGSDKFANSTAKGNNNTILLDHPASIIQQDKSAEDRAACHSTPEENNSVTSISSGRETVKVNVSMGEKQMLDSVLNVGSDISKDLVQGPDVMNQRECIQWLPRKTVSKRSNEVTLMTKNQNERLHSSDVDLLYKCPQNEAVAARVQNNGVDISLNVKNSISKEIESLTEECVEKADQQNSSKENINEFRISEISVFECPDCSAVLNSFNGFITHMNSHIMQERLDVDNLQCKNCKEKFNDKESLSLHKKKCKYSKESTLPLPQNKCNSNVECPNVNCCEENYAVSNEQNILKEKSKLELSSHCQETSQKNLGEQELTSRRQHQELSSFSPKKRRQTNDEECSTAEMADNSNSWTVQNLGAADDAFDVSWSSEIKCREEREGKSLPSVRTLSLRLFRFRRPRVVVKRAQVPVRTESVIKTLNSSSENSCPNSIINQKTMNEEGNGDCNSSKHLTKEPVTSEVNKIAQSDSKVMNCNSVSQPIKKQKNELYSHKKWQNAKQHKSPDVEKGNLQTKVTVVHPNPQYEECPVISNEVNSFTAKIPETDKRSNLLSIDANKDMKVPDDRRKDMKIRSNLKIKIKPVVVLDRLSSFNLNHNSKTSSKENTSKCVASTNSQKNLPSGININMNSSISEICEAKSKIIKTLAEQPANHLDCNDSPPDGNGISIADLERKYCLKKCYVKLKRISDEPCALETIQEHNDNKEEAGSEVRTCGKIKLRRTSSKMWTVSSCSSSLETMEVAECTEDNMETAGQIFGEKNSEHNTSEEVMQSEICSQRLKSSRKCEETFHKHMVRGKRVKRFGSECTLCQKIFFDEQDLTQHLETHLSGYKCPNCSARFHFVMEFHAHVAGCSLARLLECHKAQSQIKPCRIVL